MKRILALGLLLALVAMAAPDTALAWNRSQQPSVFGTHVDPWRSWGAPHHGGRRFHHPHVFVSPRVVAPPVVVVPPHAVWIQPQWAWNGFNWVWVPGHWVW